MKSDFLTVLNRHQGVEEFDAASLGQWAEVEGGGLLWGLSIRSPGAKSQMLLFRQAPCMSKLASPVTI